MTNEATTEGPGVDFPDWTPDLYAALAKAQALFKTPKKDLTADTGTYTYNYASLANVMEAVREGLAKHGLAIYHQVHLANPIVHVRTVLAHESGQWIDVRIDIPVKAFTAHGIGSAITYGRRYGASCLLAIAPDEDDDGNAAVGHTATTGPKTTKKPPTKKKAARKATRKATKPPAADDDPLGSPDETASAEATRRWLKGIKLSEDLEELGRVAETIRGGKAKLTEADYQLLVDAGQARRTELEQEAPQ